MESRAPPPGPVDLTLTYSFGGAKDAPLVRRTLPFKYDPALHASGFQEALLERTALVIQDLCGVIDNAMDALDRDPRDLKAFEAAAGGCMYGVQTLIRPCPSAKYRLFLTRLQRVMAKADTVKDAVRPAAWAQMHAALEDTMAFLRDVDACMDDNTNHTGPDSDGVDADEDGPRDINMGL